MGDLDPFHFLFRPARPISDGRTLDSATPRHAKDAPSPRRPPNRNHYRSDALLDDDASTDGQPNGTEELVLLWWMIPPVPPVDHSISVVVLVVVVLFDILRPFIAA